MHSFKVTTWPDETHHTVEAHLGSSAGLHHMTVGEAEDLLDCLKIVLAGGECEVHGTHQTHQIERHGSMFVLMLPVSDSFTKAYTVNKTKLIELKSGLMGALNG